MLSLPPGGGSGVGDGLHTRKLGKRIALVKRSGYMTRVECIPKDIHLKWGWRTRVGWVVWVGAGACQLTSILVRWQL